MWRGASLLVGVVACYAPNPTAGAPCASGDLCPDPLICDLSTMTCQPPDGPTGDGAPRDQSGTPDDMTTACVGHDEDGDSIADACDNCPHVANVDQANDGDDELGDVCDPDPFVENRLVLFESFATAGAWELDSGWSVANDELVQSSTLDIHYALAPAGITVDDFVIDIGMVFDTPMYTAPFFSSAGSVAIDAASSDYRCLDRATAMMPQQMSINLVNNALTTQSLTGGLAGVRGTSRFSRTGSALRCRGSFAGQPFDMSANDSSIGATRPGVRTQYVSARFQYVVVYE